MACNCIIESVILSLFIITCTIYYIIIRSKPAKRLKYKKTDVLVITGCDSGIGLELAQHFATKYEFQVIACLLELNNSQGHAKLKHLMSSRSNLHLQKLDIRVQGDIEKLVDYINSARTIGEFHNLIGLINNAGILVFGEFDWLTWNQIDNLVRINILGTVAVTKSLVPQLVESGGRIINFSSVCDNVVMPGTSVYAATKAALSTFSHVIGYELEKFGVKTIKVKLGDFAKLTNIMARHESNKDEMLREFDERKKLTYDGYFDEFQELVSSKSGFTGVSSYDESSLFDDIESALFLENPPITMTIAPLKFKILYSILEMLPVQWTYFLLRKSIPITLNKQTRPISHN